MRGAMGLMTKQTGTCGRTVSTLTGMTAQLRFCGFVMNSQKHVKPVEQAKHAAQRLDVR